MSRRQRLEPAEPFLDEDGILCFGEYQPRRGGINRAHDEYSALILTLKDGPRYSGYEDAAQFFRDMLVNEFADNCAFAVVPSHDPDKLDSGIRDVAQRISSVGSRIDATGCLQREELVRKATHGGPRGISHHIESIGVVTEDLPRADRVVVVLDDVATSGSSLLACRKLLVWAGMREVILCALGRTVR